MNSLLARRASQRAAEAIQDARELITRGEMDEAEDTLLEALRHLNNAIGELRILRGRST